MKRDKLLKLLKEQRATKNGRIVCDCGRKVKIDNIVYCHPIDINYFDLWMYNWTDDYSIKLSKPKKWYGYIGYVPILNNIVYYLYQWFHKKKYIVIVECKYCYDED